MIRKIDIYFLLLLVGVLVFSTLYNKDLMLAVKPVVEEVKIVEKKSRAFGEKSQKRYP